ncbi:hypothetical protein GH5_00867 [Leishmania sp. Ghana 2012 LV757]|uniref:hypothetical protein n=1 Tax=Leishmania sp. Ghana 2012 LV757 TaxID=2803181 RepID=UPI001B661A61|nr:hypothetical protein GH5_00867 [Leishmania sp. Ghana 2012 LV757]
MTFTVEVEPYGYDKLVWLKTDALKVGLTNYAASVASIQVHHPAANKWIEVNCGYPKNPEEAYGDPDYMGATVGRCAGRVAGGTFALDGVKYYTQKNRGENTCHCGDDAYHKKHWGMKLIETVNVIGVRFNYVSPHMESGFPGEVQNYCTFTIERSKPNALKTIYDSYITDNSPSDACPVNIFSHTSFNLNGIPGQQNGEQNWTQPESVRNHWLRVPASRVAEADRAAIPTGEFLPVEGTGLDFRKGRVIGECIDDVALLDRDPCGYDHPLAIDGWEKGKLMLHAEAKSPVTNICMKVYSTFPCMWVYTANNKPLPASGGPGQRYARWSGLLVGPQNFSDVANHHPKYPSCIVRRGERQYSETTVNEFTIEE